MGKDFDFGNLNDASKELIKKYSESNVIVNYEKEHKNNSIEVNTSSVDDNSCFKRTPLNEDSLKELADAIKEKGLDNPIIVRAKDNGKFELILGRKRLYACKKNGISKIKVVVEKVSDEEFLCMQVANNRLDKNANVVEMAYACRALQTGFGYTQNVIAYLAKQSRCQITNTLRILKLPRDVLDQVSVGVISYGQGKAIASLPKEAIIEIAALIIKKDLNVRDVEELARKYKKKIAKGDIVYKETVVPSSSKVKMVKDDNANAPKYDTSVAEEKVKVVKKPAAKKVEPKQEKKAPVVAKEKVAVKKASAPKPKASFEDELASKLGCEVVVRKNTVVLVFKDEKEVKNLSEKIK